MACLTLAMPLEAAQVSHKVHLIISEPHQFSWLFIDTSLQARLLTAQFHLFTQTKYLKPVFPKAIIDNGEIMETFTDVCLAVCVLE